MRITVSGNGRHVDIRIKGNSPKQLRKAERTALRLLDAAPAETEHPPAGFPRVSDTELADQDT